MDLHDFWNAALTIGLFFGGFMLNRMTSILDRLQEADKQLHEDITTVKAQYAHKTDMIAYGDRLEKRLESYMALHMETSKTIFAKLDILADRQAQTITRAECVQMMSDRRQN